MPLFLVVVVVVLVAVVVLVVVVEVASTANSYRVVVKADYTSIRNLSN